MANENKLTLLFLDASHFVMGCDFLGFVYGKVRRFVKIVEGAGKEDKWLVDKLIG